MTFDRSVRVLVTGCGSIGRRHIRNLKTLGFTRIVVHDTDSERSTTAGRDFNVDVLRHLDDGGDFGAAFICTPTRYHISSAETALRRSAHLFIEKPIADSLDGVDGLLEAANARNRRVMVAFNLRYHPCLQRVRQLVEDGDIGRVLAARIQFGQFLPDWHPWEDYRQGYSANRRLGGGIVLDATHEFDYARWILGEVEAITGLMTTTGSIEIDTEDLAAFTLRHEGGAISEIHLDYLQRTYSRTCQLIGTEGTIRWDWNERVVECFRARTGSWERFSEPQGYDENQTYIDEVIEFFDAVEEGRTPASDGRSGARVLEIAMAGKQAATTGRTVTW